MYKAAYYSQWNRLNVPFGDWYAMVRIDRVLLLHWDVWDQEKDDWSQRNTHYVYWLYDRYVKAFVVFNSIIKFDYFFLRDVKTCNRDHEKLVYIGEHWRVHAIDVLKLVQGQCVLLYLVC